MYAVFVIVFRETLEAALVISIVLAAVRGVPGSRLWATAGSVGGLAGAGLVALFAGAIANALAGVGQEVLNASILFLAVLMLGWHSIWMSTHGRELAQSVAAVGKAVASQARPLYAIAIVIGVAILREGSETVLFLMGALAGDDTPLIAGLLAGLLGAGAAILVGAGLYAGLLRIPLKHLFSVTNALIIFVMAGMAAQGAGFLVQADLLPPLSSPAWDTSWLLSEQSIAGKLFHALLGYEARPAGIQVAFYLAVVLSVVGLSHFVREGAARGAKLAIAGGLAAGLVFVSMPEPARAEFKIEYPQVDYREVEVEHNFSTSFDNRAYNNGRNSMTTEFGIGVLPFLSIEYEGEFNGEPGQPLAFTANTLETTWMLTEPGKYFLDFALFAEYSRSVDRNQADSVKVGMLFQKEVGTTIHTLNLFWEKPVGPLADPIDTFDYAWQSRINLSPYFQPGFEVYGEIEDVSNPGVFNKQQFRIGPMFAGSVPLGQLIGIGKLKYEAGYLFGATSATEQGTLRTRFELEIPF